MSYLDDTLMVVPIYDPGAEFQEFIDAYNKQKTKPRKVLLIETVSGNSDLSKFDLDNFDIQKISKEEFNHGGTRQSAINAETGFSYVVYLTQDALLASSDSIESILRYFDDVKVAAVCGRQLPRVDAGFIEAHSRIYNYSNEANVRQYGDGPGLKTIFLSNSFAAYRISALLEVGGFPNNVIFGEDMYVAAKLIQKGYKIAYAADACVYHSHDYSVLQEMKRYFDMGVFHAREPWIRREFGTAEGEGLKFVISEIKYLMRHAFWRVPEAILRTISRYAGFRLGLAESHIPLSIKQKISMNPGYFKSE